MGLIRNLSTAFTAAGLWVVGMPFVVRSRMNGYVERVRRRAPTNRFPDAVVLLLLVLQLCRPDRAPALMLIVTVLADLGVVCCVRV